MTQVLEPTSTPTLDRLTHFHEQIIDLALQGMKQVDIATKLNRHPSTIGLVMRSGAFQNALALRRVDQRKQVDQLTARDALDAMEILKENAHLASRKMVQLMEYAESEKVQLSAAKEILHMTYGREAKAGIEIKVLDAGSIQLLVQVLKEDGGPSSGLAQELEATQTSEELSHSHGVQSSLRFQSVEETGGSGSSALTPPEVVPDGLPPVFTDPDCITIEDILGKGKEPS